MAPKPPSGGKGSKSTPKARKSATAGSSSSKSKVSKRPSAKQVKTKPGVHSQVASTASKPSKRREKTYTDAELKLPALNMITPVGVQKPRGKKKGKVFVDDKEGMMTILAMVNAEKEGQIESKMIKARQLEEIREARRKEMEKKQEKKQAELEEVKRDLKKGKKRRDTPQDKVSAGGDKQNADRKNGKSKKRVSFA